MSKRELADIIVYYYFLIKIKIPSPSSLPPDPKRTRSIRPRYDYIIECSLRIESKPLSDFLNALGAEIPLGIEIDALALPPALLEPQLTRHRQSVRELRLARAELPVGLGDGARLHAPAQDGIKRLWIGGGLREGGREGRRARMS